MGAGEFAGVCVCAVKTTTQSHFRHVPTCLLLDGVLLGGLCFRATADLYEVNGRKIEVSLHFDQPTAMLGEAV